MNRKIELTNSKSFIWQQSGKYDIIVRYMLEKGTADYLNAVSVPHGSSAAFSAASSNLVIKKLETYTVPGGLRLQNYNFGFPGASVPIHFNPKIIQVDIINVSTPGLKGK